MEYDRYQVNSRLFILGMVCLGASICLILFSLYILPGLIGGLVYNIPEFLFHWVDWFQRRFDLSNTAASWIVLLLFFIPGLLFAMIAYYSSNKIDDQIYGLEPPEIEEIEVLSPRERIRKRESRTFVFKLLILILLVLVFAAVFEWMLYLDPEYYTFSRRTPNV